MTAEPIAKQQKDQYEIHAGDLVIGPSRFAVRVCGRRVRLSSKEFNILFLMASHPGRVFTREQLFERVWSSKGPHRSRTVDVHIRYLRRKVEPDPAKPRYIETVRGFGYRFKA